MGSFLERFTNVRRDEVPSLILSALFFFFVLTALMVVRPARESLGMQRGIEAIRWLFIGTAVVTLGVNPVFSFLVARFRRLTFIAMTYLFFAVSLLVFWAVLVFAPAAIGERSGQVFFVWFSVFNLFSTMVFWALMADRFTLEQSKRLFGIIAVGGTCGAIFGPTLALLFAERLGTPSLLLMAAGFLVLAVLTAAAIGRYTTRAEPAPGAPATADNAESAIIGGSALDGIKAVFASRYLLGISAFVLILAIIATFIYFTRLQLVAAASDSVDTQTGIFARIDLITQVSTLVLQAVAAGHLMRYLGVPVTLALLPITVALGFVGLAIASTLATITIVQASFNAVQRAIMRPARETLFTVVSRSEKYKAKAFTDTFIYRAGDVTGAFTEGLLGRLGMALGGLVTVVIPMAVVWAALGVWLGRKQAQIAK